MKIPDDYTLFGWTLDQHIKAAEYGHTKVERQWVRELFTQAVVELSNPILGVQTPNCARLREIQKRWQDRRADQPLEIKIARI